MTVVLGGAAGRVSLPDFPWDRLVGARARAAAHPDGIVEAHDPERGMYGFPRLKALVGDGPAGAALIDGVLADVEGFTGPDAEQEDDITMVALQRAVELAAFTVPSAEGNEREAIEQVAAAVAGAEPPDVIAAEPESI